MKAKAVALLNDPALPEAVRSQAQAAAERIRVRLQRTAEDIIAIGKDLLIVKAQLAHGQFGAWLQREFDFGSTTALKFMQVAERFGENTHCVNFKPAILYVLAAPATPEAVREAAMAMAQAGQTVTLADVDALTREAQRERETRQQLSAKVERLEQHNRALDQNLAAASEREQRSYRELVETQEQIASLADEQAKEAVERVRQETQTAVEHARQQAQAAQQRVEELRQQLRQAEADRPAAIQRGVNYNLAQRQVELDQLERDIQYAENSLASFRQKLREISSAEYENQRLNIDAEKVLREIVLFGTTLNLYESEEIFPVNWQLLEQIIIGAQSLAALVSDFKASHRLTEKSVAAVS